MYVQDASQYEGATYARRMAETLAAAQPVDQGANLQATCDVAQPDHAEKGDLVVKYADIKAFEALARQLAPMLADLRVSVVWHTLDLPSARRL
jgi:hypothetical protein